MGREREKKISSQQWQAKQSRSDVGIGATGRFKGDDYFVGFESGNNGGSVMREPRTKVVVRRLPPSFSEQAFVSQIEAKYGGTYSWMTFCPGKSSHRNQVFARAYIEFKSPDDVSDFYEYFDGHVFLNEKGIQYKASVEYAPYQRIPDLRAKKDVREGTILKDPDYLEFLGQLAKPAELLPSAEVQLERREAEKAALSAGSKAGPIVTPLMEFVRQKRAAKASSQRSKLGYRAGIMGPPPSNFVLQKRGSEKGKSGYSTRERRVPAERRKETFEKRIVASSETVPSNVDPLVFSETTEQQQQGKPIPNSLTIAEGDSAKDLRKEIPKRKLLVREKDNAVESSGYVIRNRLPVSPRIVSGGPPFKNLSYRERAARGATVQKDEAGTERRKSVEYGGGEEKGNGNLQDARRLRNKDRPDRPVWTPRRRSDTVETDETFEGNQKWLSGQNRTRTTRNSEGLLTEIENEADALNGSFENGTYRFVNRKDRSIQQQTDVVESGKPVKRGGGAAAFGSNEKQVWVAVQKSGSGP